MLKLIVMVVCDTCGESFEPIAVSCDRNESAWDNLTAEIEARAENRGWNLHSPTHRLLNVYYKYICPDCLDELDLEPSFPSG